MPIITYMTTIAPMTGMLSSHVIFCIYHQFTVNNHHKPFQQAVSLQQEALLKIALDEQDALCSQASVDNMEPSQTDPSDQSGKRGDKDP